MKNNLGLHLFSVCDGHGLNGHIVSQFIKDQLPIQFLQQIENSGINLASKNPNKIDNFHQRIPLMLHNCFNNMHMALKNPSGFETSLR